MLGDVFLVVGTNVINCLEWLVSKMTSVIEKQLPHNNISSANQHFVSDMNYEDDTLFVTLT